MWIRRISELTENFCKVWVFHCIFPLLGWFTVSRSISEDLLEPPIQVVYFPRSIERLLTSLHRECLRHPEYEMQKILVPADALFWWKHIQHYNSLNEQLCISSRVMHQLWSCEYLFTVRMRWSYYSNSDPLFIFCTDVQVPYYL